MQRYCKTESQYSFCECSVEHVTAYIDHIKPLETVMQKYLDMVPPTLAWHASSGPAIQHRREILEGKEMFLSDTLNT